MAARKSTASSVPSKTKPPKNGEPIRDTARVNGPHRIPSKDEVTSHLAHTLRSKFGVLLEGKLIFEADTYDACIQYRDGRGIGTIIELFHMHTEAASYAKDNRHPLRVLRMCEEIGKNPVSDYLALRFENAMKQIDDALGSEFYVNPPNGEPKWDDDAENHKRPATEDECATAKLDPVMGGQIDIDLRKPLAQQVIAGLKADGRHLLKLAEKFAARVRRGEVDLRPMRGWVVMKDGKQICEPVTEQAALRLRYAVEGDVSVEIAFEPSSGKAVK